LRIIGLIFAFDRGGTSHQRISSFDSLNSRLRKLAAGN